MEFESFSNDFDGMLGVNVGVHELCIRCDDAVSFQVLQTLDVVEEMPRILEISWA